VRQGGRNGEEACGVLSGNCQTLLFAGVCLFLRLLLFLFRRLRVFCVLLTLCSSPNPLSSGPDLGLPAVSDSQTIAT